MSDALRDFRCPSCGRLLARLSVSLSGVVESKCPRCGHLGRFGRTSISGVPEPNTEASQRLRNALHR